MLDHALLAQISRHPPAFEGAEQMQCDGKGKRRKRDEKGFKNSCSKNSELQVRDFSQSRGDGS